MNLPLDPPLQRPAETGSADQRSVRTFLMWLVLACLLPGILGASALFIYEYRGGRSQLEKDTIQTSRALVQAVDNRILRIEALAQGLSTSEALTTGDFAKFHEQAHQALAQSGLGATVVLTDPEGRQILNTAEEFGKALPPHGDPEAVRRAIESAQTVVSNVFRSTVLERHLIAVVVPVVLRDRRTFALAVTVLPQNFNDILERLGLPEGWVATILDGTGTIVARSRETERFAGEKPADVFLKRFLSADEGTVEGVMKDDVAVLAAFSRSYETNWRVSISIPQSILAGQVARRLSVLALGIAGLFALGLLLARLMSIRIARSFQALIEPATALGVGAPVTLPKVDVKEATEVAIAMGRAAQLLNERTTTLQNANRALLKKDKELDEAHCLARFGTWHWNLATGEVGTSKSLREIFGREIPPFPEQRGTLLTEESWERVYAEAQRVAETSGFDLELQVNHGGGGILWIYAKCAAIRNDAGEVIALHGTVQDITEQKHADEQIRASEEKYRTLFSNMTEGFGLGEPVFDSAGAPVDVRFLEVNQAFYAQTGVAQDVVGRPLREIMPHIEPFWIDQFCAAALTGQPTRCDNYNSHTQRHYDVHVFSPNSGRFAILFRNITEQKRVAIALQESEAYLRELVAALPGAVWTATPDGMVDFVGEQWLEFTGTTQESQLGLGFLDAIHPDDRAGLAQRWQQAVESGSACLMEYRLRRHDGGYRWFNSRGTPLRDHDGKVKRWLGVATDVDELKRTQEALQDSERRYRSLFNNRTSAIAHQRVIFDADGHPVDYTIEAVNETFEKLLGVRKEEVEGKRITEVFPSIRSFDFDPVAEFGEIARKGGEGNVEMYFAPTRRWFAIYAYSPAPGQFTAIFSDISAQKETEAALWESEYRLALALKAGGTAVWEMDVATRQMLPADALLFTMLGYAPNELSTSADWIAIMHDEDREKVMSLVEQVIAGEQESFWGELRFRAKNGKWHWVLSQAVAASRDTYGRAIRLVGTHTDITERKLAEEREREAALHDPLTSLPNRALVFEHGQRLLAGARRNHGQGALLFIDLDRFKPINDLYGHEIGDRVLKEVAARLTACTRREDLVGRLGGDEFVIFLPQLDAGRHRAAVVAQHVVESISQPFLIDQLELSLSPSIGISYYPENADDVAALIHTADLAMYQVKQTGRANYRFYTPELDQQAEENSSLEGRLKSALKNGGFALHYQPVIDIKTGELIGAEALLRLDDNGKIVLPQAFIPVAEAAGLIGELGEWVMGEACRQHEIWLEQGLRVTIAINISPLQFRQRHFADKLTNIIKEAGADPACLQLEVNESTVMESLDDALPILHELKALGVRIALDDFGTGYSNLSNLSSLPLDKLKVDQSFVRRIESDQSSRAVTEAIIALGHCLQLEVVGEGIESESVLQYLRERGCDQAQGFLFSKPLPGQEFSRWHQQQQRH
ncbi:MAG: EAL domain-containing protein [Betaproteobacteria bacterium]